MNCKYCDCHFMVLLLTEETGSNFCPNCGEPLTQPEPLSLERLKQMDGEPVYIRTGDGEQFWAIAAIDGECIFFHSADWDGNELDTDFYAMYCDLDPDGYFGLHVLGWLAYTHKPRQEENDG